MPGTRPGPPAGAGLADRVEDAEVHSGIQFDSCTSSWLLLNHRNECHAERVRLGGDEAIQTDFDIERDVRVGTGIQPETGGTGQGNGRHMAGFGQTGDQPGQITGQEAITTGHENKIGVVAGDQVSGMEQDIIVTIRMTLPTFVSHEFFDVLRVSDPSTFLEIPLEGIISLGT